MKNTKLILSICTCAFTLAFGGCATTPSGTDAAAQNAVRQVPPLKVAIDCGSCQVRPNAPELIMQGYSEAAQKSGVLVTGDNQATATIKEYVARDDTSRMLAGAFAGKDEIKVKVTYKDQSFEVSDYYRNAWLGINSLSKKIGEMIFEKIK